MTDQLSDFAVIVPCYNEESAIEATVTRLVSALRDASLFDLIVVDDGSNDRTAEHLQNAKERYPGLQIHRHQSNRGYGAAIKTALRRTSKQFIAIVDADGTYPIEKLPELLAACETQDMVVGARVGEKVTYPLSRRLPKQFLVKYINWISGASVPDMNSGMRVFRRDVAMSYFNLFPDGFSFTTTITLACHSRFMRVQYLPIDYERRIGKSKIQPLRDFLRFTHLIVRTGMYFAPLRTLGPFILLQVALMLASLFYDAFILKDMTDKTVLLALFAFNTFGLGLLGDMIVRRFGD